MSLSFSIGMSHPQDTFASVLHTTRLTLTIADPSNPAHNDHMLACFNDPVSIANMGDYGIKTRQDMIELFHSTMLAPDLCGGVEPTHPACYVVRLGHRSDGDMIGVVSLAQRGRRLPPDIGWVVLHEYAGKGYATEAAMEALRYWRDDFGIKEIMAWPKPTNSPSIRMAQRLGFVENGVAEGDDGQVHVVYALSGMARIDESTRVSFHGEQDEGKPK